MVRVAVAGAAGRMGKAVIKAVTENKNAELVSALEGGGHPMLGKDAGEVAGTGRLGIKITEGLGRALKKADVIIDFTHPDVSMRCLDEVVRQKKAAVIGTTGFSHSQRERIKELSKSARIVMAPNMSVGVNLLFKLVGLVSSIIGRDYDIEIIEAHHRHKKDAPSGTAIRLAEVAASTLGRDLDRVAVYERKGIIGERSDEEIGIQSIRAGDIVGDHTVIFAGPGERIELTHRAHSRSTFAEGAVRAALWIIDKDNGLYDMNHVLGL